MPLETRYGSTLLRQVHHIVFKNRNQKVADSLHEYDIVIAWLARKAYPHLLDGVHEDGTSRAAC